ncbi:Hypothetical predicted protein, partial [Pelobates cultripes]
DLLQAVNAGKRIPDRFKAIQRFPDLYAYTMQHRKRPYSALQGSETWLHLQRAPSHIGYLSSITTD